MDPREELAEPRRNNNVGVEVGERTANGMDLEALPFASMKASKCPSRATKEGVCLSSTDGEVLI